MKKWIESIIDFFFPKVCLYCGAPLVEGEEYICSECLLNLPRTNFHLKHDNETEQLFWGKVRIERAISFLYFQKKGIIQQLIYHLKYRGEKKLGLLMGKLMGNEIKGTSFFNDIDLLVPVPLHPVRLKRRGYNQAEWIALGVSEITGIPVCTDNLYRSIENDTQTSQKVFERWQNTRNIFRIKSPSSFDGKHLLLIDDVLTTGATLISCIETVERYSSGKVSVLTLAHTKKQQ